MVPQPGSQPGPTSRSALSAAVHAVTAGPDERALLWPRPVATYADFDTYQSWTEREIPVVMLHPRASQSTD